MKHWPRLHDSYIARAVVGSVLLAWAVLLGLDVVLAFAGDVGDIGKGGYTINHAIAATGLTIPWRAYNLFPTAAVIGALRGLGQLSAPSEWTALRALGRSDELAHSSIRFSIGRFTTEEEVDYTIRLLHAKLDKLRELSPLWEMFKDGVDLNSVQWAAH